eukprot:Lithocolla_globosa_v1_NODE_3747_length_1592_cov_20.727391.p2 type:complete len:155 gc:universal NODE_3747_length_1592_cov_20.727391:885-421(-)
MHLPNAPTPAVVVIGLVLAPARPQVTTVPSVGASVVARDMGHRVVTEATMVRPPPLHPPTLTLRVGPPVLPPTFGIVRVGVVMPRLYNHGTVQNISTLLVMDLSTPMIMVDLLLMGNLCGEREQLLTFLLHCWVRMTLVVVRVVIMKGVVANVC